MPLKGKFPQRGFSCGDYYRENGARISFGGSVLKCTFRITLSTMVLLFDFINLTQVHNFTVSAQYIFTFRRLSVFTASFTGILQVVIHIMNRFVPSYWLVKWL